jgi:hypothetical protein
MYVFVEFHFKVLALLHALETVATIATGPMSATTTTVLVLAAASVVVVAASSPGQSVRLRH